ncbi:MAG: hypothetical protein C5B48_04485 [Candidatus Rokuibacteriota bacterium]|nr:MAG: hypothetical protein C5B48_04485 [Candidatus Rokubacteria bacterium]
MIDTRSGRVTLLPLKTHIGAAARLVRYPAQPAMGIKDGEFLLAWRTGRLLGAVATFGDSSPSSTIKFAVKQQARMRRAG